MAALTTAQEYAAVREAIQLFTGTSQAVYSFTLGDMTVTYQSSQLKQLQDREEVLARRLSIRNARKRVTPDFTGGGSNVADYRSPDV